MPPPPAHQPLRQAVAKLLRAYEGNLYGADDIAALLHIAADVSGNERIKLDVDASLLVKAFTNAGEEEYTLPYDVCFGFPGDQSVLYVRKETRSNKNDARAHSIGRFRSIEAAREANIERLNVGLGEDTTNNLVQYLIKQSQPKKSKKRKKEASPKKNRKQPRQKSDVVHPASGNNNVGDTGGRGGEGQPPEGEGPPAPAGETVAVQEALEDEEFNDPVEVLYNVGGRAGKITLDPAKSYSVADLVSNLLPLRYTDTAQARKNRHAKVFYVDHYGAISFWVPRGVVPLARSHIARVRKHAEWGRKFKALFQGKKCKFSFDFHRTLAQFGLHNMRGSREGMEMLIAGVVKGLAEEIGMPLTNKQLANGCPSRRTIARAALKLGGMSLLQAVRMIKKDKAKWLALMMDHGKRSGIDHFVKLLIWAGLDDGKPVIKYFCLDVDKSGHSGVDCAAAIKKSVEKLELAGLDRSAVEIIAITGDAGGGGAVQKLWPLLKKNEVLAELAKMMNCQYHALNKCFETACEQTFGKQGIHNINIFQACFIYVQLIKMLREMGGHELIDTIQSSVVEKIMSCEVWQGEAMRTNKVACDSFWRNYVDNPDCSSDELVDELLALTTAGHRNIKSPNMARWFTILPAVKALVDNWTVIYFLCVAIVQCPKIKSEHSLSQYAGSLLANMNTASGPAGTENNNEKHCPPVYVQGLFVRAFGDAYFEESFAWLLKSDPDLGPDSWGQRMRSYLEHAYRMARGLEELMEDKCTGWMHNPAFGPFLEALEHLPDEGDKTHANREYFEDVPKCFFGAYEKMFVKHVSTIVRSNDIVVYLVGSTTPILARMFLQWLRHAKENAGKEDADISDVTGYVFESKRIRLRHHGASDDESTWVDTAKCLEWLTKLADPLKILEDPIITEHEELWWSLASVDDGAEVDLFDKSTWNGVEYQPLVEVVHGKIATHPIHQQRVENLVNMCAFVSSTNVNEATRTQRAMALSSIMRRFNEKAKREEEARRKTWNAKQTDSKKKKKETVKHVEGALRIREFGKYVDEWNAEVDAELELLGEERFKALLHHLAGDSGNSQASKECLEETKQKFVAGLQKKRKVTKQQTNSNGIDMTAEMDGAIKMVKLTKKYNKEMLAEVKARGIVLAKDWKDMDLKEKRDALRQDELKYWILAGKCRDGAEIKTVKQIIPQSEALIALKSKLKD